MASPSSWLLKLLAPPIVGSSDNLKFYQQTNNKSINQTNKSNKSNILAPFKFIVSLFECSIMLKIDSLTLSFKGLVDLSVGSKIFCPLR